MQLRLVTWRPQVEIEVIEQMHYHKFGKIMMDSDDLELLAALQA